MIAARKPQHLPRLRQPPRQVRPLQPCHEQCLQPSLPNLQAASRRDEKSLPSENAQRATTYASSSPAGESPTRFGAPFAFLPSRRVGRVSEPKPAVPAASTKPKLLPPPVGRRGFPHLVGPFFFALLPPAARSLARLPRHPSRLRFSPQGPSNFAHAREPLTGVLRKAPPRDVPHRQPTHLPAAQKRPQQRA
jgi:hypothetical protein